MMTWWWYEPEMSIQRFQHHNNFDRCQVFCTSQSGLVCGTGLHPALLARRALLPEVFELCGKRIISLDIQRLLPNGMLPARRVLNGKKFVRWGKVLWFLIGLLHLNIDRTRPRTFSINLCHAHPVGLLIWKGGCIGISHRNWLRSVFSWCRSNLNVGVQMSCIDKQRCALKLWVRARKSAGLTLKIAHCWGTSVNRTGKTHIIACSSRCPGNLRIGYDTDLIEWTL